MNQDQEAQQRRHKLMAQAVKLLARREHSRAELAAKLTQRGYDGAEVHSALDECEAQHWLDDRRFADIYVRQRKDSLYGPIRILAELQQRGINVQPDALSDTSEPEWRENATRLRAKKFGLAAGLDWHERGRQGRFMAQRGFTMSQIEHALEQRDGDEVPV